MVKFLRRNNKGIVEQECKLCGVITTLEINDDELKSLNQSMAKENIIMVCKECAIIYNDGKKNE